MFYKILTRLFPLLLLWALVCLPNGSVRSADFLSLDDSIIQNSETEKLVAALQEEAQAHPLEFSATKHVGQPSGGNSKNQSSAQQANSVKPATLVNLLPVLTITFLIRWIMQVIYAASSEKFLHAFWCVDAPQDTSTKWYLNFRNLRI
jgi:hypothetical protein